MVSSKFSLVLPKLYKLSWNILRRYSDQSLATAKKTDTSLRVPKKPCRPPFMKNIFLGKYDKEMLIYPELDKEGLAELKKKVQPYKEYFEANLDPKVISALKIIPNEIIENCKNLGLFGQIIPSLYGGSDQTAIETALITEVIAKDLDLALTLYSHNFLGVQSLVMYGSNHQKEKYLPLLASGEWLSAFCMCESVSGSDLGCIKATAVRCENNPDQYLLNGDKQWIINGNKAKLFIVIAKTDVTAHTGQTVPLARVLLVERDSPGVTVTQAKEHVGLNASNICDIYFKDTPVSADSFIGGESQGYEICAKVLNSGRYNIGAMTVSILRNLLHSVSDYIINRKQTEKFLIECEHINNKFADIAARIYALESMTYLTAAILDNYDNPDCSLELAIIKVYSFTEGRRCVDAILELMGGRALLVSETSQKYFRDFRTMEVFDGTTDIANLFISLIGLQHAGMSMHETVSKMRFPFEFPGFYLKRLFVHRKQAKDEPKLNLRLYEQLHPSLTESANELEYCVLRFEYAVSILFNRYGQDVINQQIELMRLADAAVKIFAMTAILSRSSRSYCIGLPHAETELRFAMKLCYDYQRVVRTELNNLIDGLVVSGDLLSLKFGPDIFRHHGYFLSNPLERSY